MPLNGLLRMSGWDATPQCKVSQAELNTHLLLHGMGWVKDASLLVEGAAATGYPA